MVNIFIGGFSVPFSILLLQVLAALRKLKAKNSEEKKIIIAQVGIMICV